MKLMKEILITEIKRIHADAMEGPLEMDQLKRLESLTKSWRAMFGTDIEMINDDLNGMSLNEVLELAKDGP